MISATLSNDTSQEMSRNLRGQGSRGNESGNCFGNKDCSSLKATLMVGKLWLVKSCGIELELMADSKDSTVEVNERQFTWPRDKLVNPTRTILSLVCYFLY